MGRCFLRTTSLHPDHDPGIPERSSFNSHPGIAGGLPKGNEGSLNKFISGTICPFGKGMLPENQETLKVEKIQIPTNPH
jgi:hypothetical protein